jgi:hypothetical protein
MVRQLHLFVGEQIIGRKPPSFAMEGKQPADSSTFVLERRIAMNRCASILALVALVSLACRAQAQYFYTSHYYPATTAYYQPQPVYYPSAPVVYYRSAPTTTYYASSPATVYYGAAPTTTYYASAPTTVYYGAAAPVNYYRPIVGSGITRTSYYAPPVVYPATSTYYNAYYPWW